MNLDHCIYRNHSLLSKSIISVRAAASPRARTESKHIQHLIVYSNELTDCCICSCTLSRRGLRFYTDRVDPTSPDSERMLHSPLCGYFFV